MEGELEREEISLEMPVHARLVFQGLPGWSAAIPMGPCGVGMGVLLKWFDCFYCKRFTMHRIEKLFCIF